METAQYVEELLGQNTEYDTTFGGADEAARTLARPLLKADEVRRLDREQAILVSGRERPAFLSMPPFFTVAEWERLGKKADPRGMASGDGEVAFLEFECNPPSS